MIIIDNFMKLHFFETKVYASVVVSFVFQLGF